MFKHVKATYNAIIIIYNFTVYLLIDPYHHEGYYATVTSVPIIGAPSALGYGFGYLGYEISTGG